MMEVELSIVRNSSRVIIKLQPGGIDVLVVQDIFLQAGVGGSSVLKLNAADLIRVMELLEIVEKGRQARMGAQMMPQSIVVALGVIGCPRTRVVMMVIMVRWLQCPRGCRSEGWVGWTGLCRGCLSGP